MWYWVIDKFSHVVFSEHASKVGAGKVASKLRREGTKVQIVKVEIVEGR